jgi:TM2 domain-containing membrane protein YozV
MAGGELVLAVWRMYVCWYEVMAMATTAVYPNAEQVFQMQYGAVRRDEVVGVLLALFLGCFGIHHFYVGRNTLGIVYLCLFWTGIPAILGLIECFFMPGRVRAYNAILAAGIAASLGIGVPAFAGYGYGGEMPVGFTQGAYYGPGYNGVSYAQPHADGYAPVYRGHAVQAVAETTLVVCATCRMTNPVGSRFCSGCGSGLV